MRTSTGATLSSARLAPRASMERTTHARAEDAGLAAAIAHVAQPLADEDERYDGALDVIGDAEVVLLGEATHGTHEFYAARATITRRLVEERGFAAVAIEGDWPHAHRVHRYVQGESDDRTPEQALSGFERFPQWMWRNREIEELVSALRELREAGRPLGFHGLDLYSLHDSMAEVVAFLDEHDPEEADRARLRYACFDRFGEDPQAYGYLAGRSSCEDEVVEQLVAIQRRAAEGVLRDGAGLEEARFDAEMNARVVRDAEAYYRTMFRGRVESWNLRDTHMADTLDALLAHLRARGLPPKVVVWAHNSHLGDARATELGEGGELNLGQLARERYGDRARLIGFSTYHGTVTAASDWDAPAQRRRVRKGLRGSFEALFHQVGIDRFLLDLRDLGEASGGLREERLQRAIGVVYRPDSERSSHYFHAKVARQFDAVLHFDETRAVEPLERTPLWIAGEVAETYPSGL